MAVLLLTAASTFAVVTAPPLVFVTDIVTAAFELSASAIIICGFVCVRSK